MKIQTDRRGWFGQIVKLGNQKVEFNGQGVAEVDNKIGTQLMTKYNTMVFPAGSLPQKEAKVPENVSAGEAKELLNEVERLKGMNAEQKEQHDKNVAILENEIQAWKDKFQEAADGNVDAVKQAIGDEEFKALAALIDQNVTDLRALAVEKFKMEQAFVDGLKKPEVIVEIFKTILNADYA